MRGSLSALVLNAGGRLILPMSNIDDTLGTQLVVKPDVENERMLFKVVEPEVAMCQKCGEDAECTRDVEGRKRPLNLCGECCDHKSPQKCWPLEVEQE